MIRFTNSNRHLSSEEPGGQGWHANATDEGDKKHAEAGGRRAFEVGGLKAGEGGEGGGEGEEEQFDLSKVGPFAWLKDLQFAEPQALLGFKSDYKLEHGSDDTIRL
jgi:hypothetical protein